MSIAQTMTASPDVYRERRKRLAGGISRPLLLAAGNARARHYATNTHPFRAGSNYLYFGGPPIQGASLLVEPGSDGIDGCTLLRPPHGFEDAVWFGEVTSDDVLSAAAGLGANTIRTPDQLKDLLRGRKSAFVTPPCPPTWDWIGGHDLEPATGEEQQVIIDMRLIKDSYELSALRRAAVATAAAHRAAAAVITPGGSEAEVAGAFHGELFARNCRCSFTPIISVRGEVLHSETYGNPLSPGDLLLMDAAAEEPTGYAGDLTRVYPVSGSFSEVQRELYNVVLSAQREAVAACVPGKRFRDIHDLSARVLCKGLCDMGLLQGDPSALVERCVHTLFFPHGLGHLIGLDVHDMEDFGDLAGYQAGRRRRTEFGNKFLRLDRDLEPGMVVTIEPGVYFVPAVWREEKLLAPLTEVVNRKAVDNLLQGGFGGIRIEDMVHVRESTDGGPEVLTAALPTDADAVEALVGSAAR